MCLHAGRQSFRSRRPACAKLPRELARPGAFPGSNTSEARALSIIHRKRFVARSGSGCCV